MEYTEQQDLTPLEQATLFFELGKPLAKAKSVQETLNAVMYLIGHIFEPVHWSIILKDPKTGDMVFTKVVGSHKKFLEGKRLSRGEGIAGHILASGTPLIVDNVAKDPRFSSKMDRLTGFQTKSIIGVPLKTNDKIFGVLEMVNKLNGGAFTTLELQVLSSIAEYAAIAIERSYFNQALKRLALTDPLTELPNRIRLQQIINNPMEFTKRCQTPVSIMRINLLNAHDICARKGEATGNQVIKKLAAAIQESMRKGDTLFRSDFSDFIVLMPHTSIEMAEEAGDRMRLLEDKINAAHPEQDPIMLSVKVHILTKGKVKDLFATPNGDHDSGVPDPVDMGNMEKNLQPMLDREHREQPAPAPSNKPFGKTVNLSGEYITFDKKHRGPIKVREVSLKGCGFTMTGRHQVRPHDILDIGFILDNADRSKIKRRVVVESVRKELIRGKFYNPPPYDKDLGFYLIN